MAYLCPKCGGELKRDASPAGRFGGGLVGVMLAHAFAGLACNKCGAIRRAELSPDDRSAMTRNSVILVVGALVLLAAVVGVVVGVR